MEFRKKTKRTLRTLFFSVAMGVIDCQITRAERERKDLDDRIKTFKSVREQVDLAFGTSLNDYFRPKPETDSGDPLH